MGKGAKGAKSSKDGKPRKTPSGPQGEAIVQALFQAAQQIIRREGLDAATTNRIAAEAGVSIGSFYQYFPNRQVLIAEMARGVELRTAELARERIEEALSRAPKGREAYCVAEGLIDLVLSDALGSTDLRRVLQQEIPRGWVTEASEAADASVHLLVRDQIPRDWNESDPSVDSDTAAFVLVSAVEAIAEAAVARGSLEEERERLRAALQLLVVRFLALDDA